MQAGLKLGVMLGVCLAKEFSDLWARPISRRPRCRLECGTGGTRRDIGSLSLSEHEAGAHHRFSDQKNPPTWSTTISPTTATVPPAT